jgi:hypothetical protein
MHIGAGKVGNVQRTYPYITGRVFWGALTMRLARNLLYSGAAGNDGVYSAIGKQVHEQIAFTYFYPALQENDSYTVIWPWGEESWPHTSAEFRKQFISSYASTALEYPSQVAAESLLHESEFISPHTIAKESRPVYLSGYLFIHDACDLAWKLALENLRFGGDRGYGWGRVALKVCKPCDTASFFSDAINIDGSGIRPIVTLKQPHLLAHTEAKGTDAHGDIEPLVGRLWESHFGAGKNNDFCGICFRPGSMVANANTSFIINSLGIWSPFDVSRTE